MDERTNRKKNHSTIGPIDQLGAFLFPFELAAEPTDSLRLDVCAARCCSAQVSVRPCKGCSLAVPDFAFCYLCVLFSFAPTRELITLMEAIE